VWQPGRAGAWILFLVALGIIVVWPPANDKSLAVKVTNWAVDPYDTLPILPPQLGFGVGDDPEAVEARDAQVRRYDTLYSHSTWMRRRLELKVLEDPFNPATERQLLLLFGVLVVFLVGRFGGRAS